MTHRHAAALLPLLAALAASPIPASAQTPERQFSFQFGLGYDLGDEELIQLTFTDGSKESLKSEQGFFFYGGVGVARIHTETVSLDTGITLGIKGWNVGSGGDTLNYLVFPLEVTERLWAGPFRLGAGFSFLLSPGLNGKGVLDQLDVDFDNSLGVVVQAEWIGERKPGKSGASLGLRYAFHKLKANGGTVDANTLGFSLGFDF